MAASPSRQLVPPSYSLPTARIRLWAYPLKNVSSMVPKRFARRPLAGARRIQPRQPVPLRHRSPVRPCHMHEHLVIPGTTAAARLTRAAGAAYRLRHSKAPVADALPAAAATHPASRPCTRRMDRVGVRGLPRPPETALKLLGVIADVGGQWRARLHLQARFAAHAPHLPSYSCPADRRRTRDSPLAHA